MSYLHRFNNFSPFNNGAPFNCTSVQVKCTPFDDYAIFDSFIAFENGAAFDCSASFDYGAIVYVEDNTFDDHYLTSLDVQGIFAPPSWLDEMFFC